MSFPFTKAKGIPTLTQDDLAQDKIPGKVDQLFDGDTTHKQLSKAILREQHRLQEQVSTDAWLSYLTLEQFTNQRVDHMLTRVAQWAWHQGRKSRGE